MSDININTTVPLGSINDIAPGQGRCYQVDGEPVAVFRQRNGKILAIQNRCPHKNGPLCDGLAGDDTVVCPLHGHRFNLVTGKGSEPGEAVKTFKIEVQNSQIAVVIES